MAPPRSITRITGVLSLLLAVVFFGISSARGQEITFNLDPSWFYNSTFPSATITTASWNTYVSSTTISAGTLLLNNPPNLVAGNLLIFSSINSAGLLYLTNSTLTKVGGGSPTLGGGNITLGSGNLMIGESNLTAGSGNLTLSGGALALNNSTLTLNGTNLIISGNFTQWANAVGLSGANAQIAAKPFTGGPANVIRYAMNLGTAVAPANVPQPTVTTINGVPCLTIQYRVRKNMTDYQLVPQYSTDFTHWINVSAGSTTPLADADATTSCYQAAVTIPAGGSIFLRVVAQ